MSAFLTLDQAADLMGVSRRTINRWIASRKLAVVRPTKRTARIRRTDLDRTLEKFTHRAL